MSFRTRDPRLLRASLICFALSALIGWAWYGCAGVPMQRGFATRQGASNGAENDGRTGILNAFAFEFLAPGALPVRKDHTAHPIISGDPARGFITQGTANQRPDAVPLTAANYSGFVLLTPGLDWRGMR